MRHDCCCTDRLDLYGGREWGLGGELVGWAADSHRLLEGSVSAAALIVCVVQ